MRTTRQEPVTVPANSSDPRRETSNGSAAGRRVAAPRVETRRDERSRGGDDDPRRFLREGSPSVLLERWVAGDPLGVRPRVYRHLAREALFVDADRVHLRALALGAFEASAAPARGSLGPWLDSLVDRATRALLKEDALGDPPAEESELGACRDLARQLDLDPARVRGACLALDLRPLEERKALQDLLVERVSLDEAARRAGTSATEVARRARRALLAGLALLDESALDDSGEVRP